jgi:hypothetical protein
VPRLFGSHRQQQQAQLAIIKGPLAAPAMVAPVPAFVMAAAMAFAMVGIATIPRVAAAAMSV